MALSSTISLSDHAPAATQDVEKNSQPRTKVFHAPLPGMLPDEDAKLSIWQQLSSAGVEHRGSKPVPVELRTDTRYFDIFTTMCTPMLSILP